MINLKQLVKTLSVLLLGTSTSLSAQNAPPKPTQKPAPQKQVPQVKPAVTPSKENNYSRPVLTPEEVIQGLLRLADSVHEKSDITAEQVKQSTGIWLMPQGNSSERYGFIGRMTTSEWHFSMRRSILISKTPQFLFEFISADQKNDPYPSCTSICGVDMDDIHATLLRTGYQLVSKHKLREIGWTKFYQRDKIFMELVYVGENAEKSWHKCLLKLIIK